MLVLQRKVGERIQIGENIELIVLKTKGGRILLGFEAPRDIPILRSEVTIDRIDSEHHNPMSVLTHSAVPIRSRPK